MFVDELKKRLKRDIEVREVDSDLETLSLRERRRPFNEIMGPDLKNRAR
jgi:hypothetical protein